MTHERDQAALETHERDRAPFEPARADAVARSDTTPENAAPQTDAPKLDGPEKHESVPDLPEAALPDQEIYRLLKAFRRIAQALDIQSRRIQRAVGLTLPQLVVLTCVRDLGEVTSRAISREADLTPATVVGILDKLETKGLIERYRSTRDRRIVHTRLTEAGARALTRAPSPLGQDFEAGFLALDAQTRRQILDAFAQTAALSAPPDDPAAI
ncbi:MAG: MarR family transcriptional regulator [Neomegalonema sp.]|nr:MarR family transcriptional regulator [Neomegalonema sp.]